MGDGDSGRRKKKGRCSGAGKLRMGGVALKGEMRADETADYEGRDLFCGFREFQ